jgi:hypothetical protein
MAVGLHGSGGFGPEQSRIDTRRSSEDGVPPVEMKVQVAKVAGPVKPAPLESAQPISSVSPSVLKSAGPSGITVHASVGKPPGAFE